MEFSAEYKEKVKENNNIVEVVSQYVKLKKSGSSYVGLCPFHSEKGPSFRVREDNQYFHCFGCQVGGDVITFIQKIENLSYVEAIEFLANRVNIPLPISNNNIYESKIEKLKREMYLVNIEAQKYFFNCLISKDEDSKRAQEYLNQRGINKQILLEFKIGFSKFGLYNYLKQKNFSDEAILNTGLVYKNKDKYIDRYFNRVIFPISDISSRIIGFGGRIIEKDKKLAKYINTNENLIYSKGRHLYAMDIAKNYSKDSIIIVEGYMDAISLHQRGIKNAVASLGTALTQNQVRLLTKRTKRVIIGYDKDEPGIEASLRAIKELKDFDVDIRVLNFKNAKDPDEFITKFGRDKFLEELDKALPYVDFEMEILEKKYDVNNLEEKIKLIEELIYIIKDMSQVAKEEYIEKFSKRFNISKSALYNDLKSIAEKSDEKEVKNDQEENFKIQNEVSLIDADKDLIDNKKYIALEREMIYHILTSPNFVSYAKDLEFNDIKNNQILTLAINAILNQDEVNKFNLEKFLNSLDEELQKIVREILLIYEYTDNNVENIIELVKKIKEENLQREKKLILKSLETTSNEEERNILENRLLELLEELKKN